MGLEVSATQYKYTTITARAGMSDGSHVAKNHPINCWTDAVLISNKQCVRERVKKELIMMIECYLCQWFATTQCLMRWWEDIITMWYVYIHSVIGDWHRLLTLDNSSKRRKYTTIVCLFLDFLWYPASNVIGITSLNHYPLKQGSIVTPIFYSFLEYLPEKYSHSLAKYSLKNGFGLYLSARYSL